MPCPVFDKLDPNRCEKIIHREEYGGHCQGLIRDPAEVLTISTVTSFLVFLGFPGVKWCSVYADKCFYCT